MPRRTDLHRILIIGSGPIIIGQACEFDYSGTQACKALREEGYEVVLINSNPATIMTDPEMADRTYIEPLTWEIVEKVIERERPDALLPTVGGQTGLNLALALKSRGRKRGLQDDVGDQIKGGIKVVAHHFGIDAEAVVAPITLDASANVFDLAGDLLGRARLRAFEQSTSGQAGDAIRFRSFGEQTASKDGAH